ncbi:hypothetical protein [Zavarzinella formosa]|uniref:hypothetical protein n=1 Tax=Zavarzinella formosa TaxID=360055 RepID=UPI0002FF7E99|nr:hypothetical protein [Zavarzinella formosa]
MRLYRYIGPQQIADRVTASPAGCPIRSAADVVRWARESGQQPGPDGSVIATFVIDATGLLLIADRHSEHVACAGRLPVRSAGEITFALSGNEVEITAVSNQSTGYCPEPDSWAAVMESLTASSLEPPSGFSPRCVFRLCVRCAAKNIVKDGVFECGVCGAELSVTYNCQTARAESDD